MNWKDAEWLVIQTPGSSTFKIGVSSISYKNIVGKVVKLVPAEFGPTLWSLHKFVAETNLNYVPSKMDCFA